MNLLNFKPKYCQIRLNKYIKFGYLRKAHELKNRENKKTHPEGTGKFRNPVQTEHENESSSARHHHDLYREEEGQANSSHFCTL